MAGEKGETGLAKAVWTRLSEWPERPGPIGLDSLPKQGPAVMVRPLGAAVEKKRFVDGGALCGWLFALRVRTGDMADTAARFEAERWLLDGVAFLRAAPLRDAGRGLSVLAIEAAGLPAQVAAHEDGSIELEMTCRVTYKEDADG